MGGAPTALPDVTAAGTVWIASDLHLQPATPQTCEAFIEFLAAAAEQADALFLLGDTFDAWVGDDVLHAPPPWLADIIQAMAATGRSTALWLGHGNRDFLIGDHMADAVGGRLLPLQARLLTDCGPMLLTHGDELCTDDTAYQHMRNVVRDPAWQADILARSLPERMQIAAQLRSESETGKAGKSMEIMDVNQAAVEELMRDTGVLRLIHGHTHRPGRHGFMLDGRPAERWVLPDWDFDGTEVRGGWLAIDRDGPALHDLLPA